MKIVIDTNILISALIKDSLTRELLVNKRFKLMIPAYRLGELEKYKSEICNRANITNQDFYNLLGIIIRNVKIIPLPLYKDYSKESENIMKNIDIKDAPF